VGSETAARLSTLVGSDVGLLAQIPFDSSLREGGDNGEPIVLASPQAPASRAIDELLEKLLIRPRTLVGVPLTLHT
jgi:ATP-binding protein involved in chromosome partitioning